MTEPVVHAQPTVTGRVLVVDDHALNRQLMEELLEPCGHRVIAAATGSEALAVIATDHPDLVLLDINLPDLDGFEVCRRLRADPETASLPVILVTALSHRSHRLEGIAAGANDYLTKPIDRTDLVLRVRNALALHRLHDELAERYRQLRHLEQLRDGLVQMIVHDLRSPLMGIMAYLQLIREDLAGPRDLSEVNTLLSEAQEVASTMAAMVTDVLDVSRLEAAALPLNHRVVDLSRAAASAITACGGRAMNGRVRVIGPAPPILVDGDLDLLRRVFTNLVANALKFSPSKEPVTVRLQRQGERAEVAVIDTGSGIPPEYLGIIFDKFRQAPTNGRLSQPSTGLGLTFCKLIVEAHGGTIGVDSTVGQGSTFWLTLPLAATDPH